MFWQPIRIGNRLSQELRRQRALMSPPVPVPAATGGGGNEAVAATTFVSETTPDKVLKKSRVATTEPDASPISEEEDSTPVPTPKKSLDDSFKAASSLGQTGTTPDHLASLQLDNSNLQSANSQLHETLAGLQEELDKAKQALQNKQNKPSAPVVPGNPPPQVTTPVPNGSDDAGLGFLGEVDLSTVGDDAARKRLERLCKRRASGKLAPKFINDLSHCFEEVVCGTIHVI